MEGSGLVVHYIQLFGGDFVFRLFFFNASTFFFGGVQVYNTLMGVQVEH